MKVGDICYIIANGRIIKEATITKVSGNLYTIRFTGTYKAITLPKHRLYDSVESANKILVDKGIISTEDKEIRANRPPELH